MHKTTLFLLTTFLVLLGACAPKAEQPVAAPAAAVDTAAIRAMETERLNAISKGDVEGYLAVYSDKAVWMPPQAPEIVGKAAARYNLKQTLADASFSVQVETSEQVVMSPEWVLDRGSFIITRTEKKDGEEVSSTGSYVTVWNREADGKWRISYDIWNSKPGS